MTNTPPEAGNQACCRHRHDTATQMGFCIVGEGENGGWKEAQQLNELYRGPNICVTTAVKSRARVRRVGVAFIAIAKCKMHTTQSSVGEAGVEDWSKMKSCTSSEVMGAGIRDKPTNLNDFEYLGGMNRRTAVFRSSTAEKSKSDLEPAGFIYNPHTTVDIEYSHAFPSKSTNQACGGELIRPDHDLVDMWSVPKWGRVLGSTSHE